MTRSIPSPYFNRYFEKTGATTTLYVFARDQLLATIEGNGSATSTYIAHTDHLSGSNVMSDKDGALAQLSTYYPYGSIRRNEQPSSGFNEKRKFIGEYYDDATSLNYLNARYYNAGNGNFLSQNPVARDVAMMSKMPAYLLVLNQSPGTVDQTMLLSDPQMLNSYSYSRNNPITMSDPSGQHPYLVVGGAAFAASVSWNLAKDVNANLHNPAVPWYMKHVPQDANPGARYFKDASVAAGVAVGTVYAGAALEGTVAAGTLTAGGAQVVTATAGGLLNAGAGLYTGSSRDPVTGQVSAFGVATDFAAGFVGTRIGQQIPNPAGRPPITIAGSLGGARAATEQMRAQLGQVVQALGAYVMSLGGQQKKTQ